MNIKEIIATLKKHNVVPRVAGDQLKLTGETASLPSSLIAEIRAVKQELIAFLQDATDTLDFATIVPVALQKSYPVSNAQKRLWVLSQFEGSETAYNIVTGLYLKGTVIRPYLQQAFQRSVEKHESLRTVFIEQDGIPEQVILDIQPFELAFEDISLAAEPAAYLVKEVEAAFNHKFDLQNGPLIQVKLFRISEKEHAIILNIHHLVSDGWSIGVLLQEVMMCYEEYCRHENPVVVPLKIQYKDYAAWLSQKIAGEKGEQARAFWENEFQTPAVPLVLPATFARKDVKSFDGAMSRFYFDEQVYADISTFCRNHQVTLFNLLRSLFTVLLHKFSGQDDITIGVPVAGRNNFDLQNQIGLYVNTLPLRTAISPEDTFLEFLQKISQHSLNAFGFQDYPLDRMVDNLDIRRDTSRNPLFDVVMVLQDTALGDGRVNLQDQYGFELNPLDSYCYTSTPVERQHVPAKFDLSFNFANDPGNKFYLEIEYATSLFTNADIQRFYDALINIIMQVLHAPEVTLRSIKILSDEAAHQILTVFNNTAAAYPAAETMLDLFSRQVASHPEAIALLFENEALTYAALDARSNQLAHYLRSRGVGRETLVPVCIERSVEMMVVILSILKAGAAYVPIDPSYPAPRISYILADTGAKLVISSRTCRAALENADVEIEIITPDNSHTYPETPTGISLQPDQLAYIIYTSGSTGKPKGVMIEHSSVVNLIYAQTATFHITAGERILQFSNYCFDAAVEQMFLALFNGAVLVLFPEGLQLDVARFEQFLQEKGVTHLHATPGFLNTLQLEDTGALRRVISGGETCSTALLKRWAGKVDCYNEYGPTEVTVTAIEFYCSPDHIDEWTALPIGRPLANTAAYLLDREGLPVPVGLTGELYLAGPQVARGYLNAPELTAEKFVSNPFSTIRGGKMYKTGDLGKWLPDGTIMYLSRIDDQVKIRGYRIEPGEVESVLLKCSGVQQAVVIASPDKSGNKRLVAFIVPRGDFNKEGILIELKGMLPEYMIPSLLVALESLPLTSNGKIDKKALPDADATLLLSNEYVAPRNIAELTLAGIWQDLLGIVRAGIHDNFFELGGDSIIAIQVVSRAKRAGYILRPQDIFTHQTIAALAVLQTTPLKITGEGEQGLLTGASGLLPIQQRYFETGASASIPFNQTVLLAIDKKITALTLTGAIKALLRTHDALRFVYPRVNNNREQHYGTYEGVLAVDDLQFVTPASLTERMEQLALHYQQDIDIEEGILLRAILFLTPASDTENRLLLIIHHLAIDGVSWRILLDDLQALLEKNDPILPQKGSSYRQWYETLVLYGQSSRFVLQQPYWQQVAAGYLPFRTDTPYTEKLRRGDIAQVAARLDSMHTHRLLHEVPQVYHTVIDDLLLCALALTLTEWTGHPEVVIGMESHGRENREERIDIARTVGWFTTLYPVLLQVRDGEDQDMLLKSVKEQLRQVPDKGLGYGILKYINKADELSGEEPWDILFNYLGQLDHVAQENAPLRFETASFGSPVGAAFPVREKLAVDAMVQGGELLLQWNYSSKHYHRESIQTLAARCVEHLEALIAHCLSQPAPVFTPADFGLSGEISIAALDAFLAEKGNTIEGIYRLSGLQEGLLFHALYGEQAGVYTEQFCCDLHQLSTATFRQSWEVLLERHTILRSAFHYNEFSIPVQCVYREVALPFEVLDYRGMSAGEQTIALENYAAVKRQQGFDFAVPCLMRITLIQLDEQRYRLLWDHHHILFDGWSLAVLMEELFTVYEQLQADTALPIIPPDRYEDYIRYQENLDQDLAVTWWRNYLKEISEGSLLPFITTTGDRNKGIGTYASSLLQITTEATRRLTAYVQQHRITLNTLIQGVWAYLLSRYTGQESVVYGVTVSGRPDHMEGIEQRVGLYINTLPLYTRIADDISIVDWLRQLQINQLQCREHQYTPLGVIQSLNSVGNELFDSLMVFENYPVSKMFAAGSGPLKVDNIYVEEHTNYAFTITVTAGEQLNIRFNYNSRLLDAAYVAAIAGHFEQVLLQLPDHATLGDIVILTPEEQHQLSAVFNNDTAAYLPGKTVTALFEEQVNKTPGNTALVFEDITLTYAALNEKANQLGHYLREHYKIQPDDLIGIRLERSEWMIIAILGVLKAGAGYVPIDPAYPQERIDFMLQDSHCKVVLDEVMLDTWREELKGYSDQHLPAVNQPADLMYVIYTSGSTGKPKGVLITHQSVAALIQAQSAYFNISSNENILQFSNYCFDAAVEQIFLALLNGASLVLFPEGLQLNTDRCEALLREREITHLHATPGFLEDIRPAGYPHLKRVIAGGDVCSRELSRRWEGWVDFYNEYGPTETTVTAIEYHLPRHNSENPAGLPIGKPLSTVKALILDHKGNPVPVGVAGELFIGGIQVARGYLNQPELTAERFIPDASGAAGARLYKTGDLARWLPDGNISFIGRKDDQVKIRGYRIETGEIENILLEYPEITAAVVIAKTMKEGEKELVAYVVSDQSLNTPDLRHYLGKRLPVYMVPSHFVQLPALPLTANGKVDKKGLPAPESMGLNTGVAFVAPRNEMEEKLVLIWQEVLAKHTISVKDNFFDLGGHSLKATRLTGLIHKTFNVKIALKDLFATAVLEEQALLIAQSEKEVFSAIPLAAKQPHYPLSSSQRRLWILSQFEEGNVAYNMPGVYVLEGDLHIPAFTGAFEQLIKRHEILRTVFKEDEAGDLKQFVNESSGFHITVRDLRQEIQQTEVLQALIRTAFSTPFVLRQGPLLRAGLYQIAGNKWVLVYVMHHIISDGVSMVIMMKELMQCYNGGGDELMPLGIQFKDYATWQQARLSGADLRQHKAWWLQQFEGELPVLELQGDVVRPAVKTYNGGIIRLPFSKAITHGLKILSGEHGGTLFMGLLAAVNALLFRYTQQEDIIIGTQIAGREHADLEDQIGVYLNTLALRARFSGAGSFLDLLEHVREVTVAAYQHQAYPFDELVDALQLPYNRSRHPLFDVSVVLHNSELSLIKEEQQTDRLNIKLFENSENLISKFDLAFDFTETADAIEAMLVYNSDIYQEDTASRMLQHLEQILAAALAQPSLPLYQLDYLSTVEKQQLLESFNDTAIPYPADKTIVDLFEEQVLLHPDKPALEFENIILTYRELDEQSTRLAAYLRATYAPQPGEIIGIMLDRSASLLISILGILKAGAAYVPVDPDYPAGRKAFILEDTRVKILLTQTEYVFDLSYYTGQVFAVDIQLEGLPAADRVTGVPRHAGSLAYVMYTSGSTGNPKGVLVTSQSVVRLVKSANYVSLTGEEVLLSTGAVSFDATTFEYWGMLLNGGRLVLCSKEVLLDGARLEALILDRGITMMWFTAGWLNQLVDSHLQLFRSLKTLLAGGDQLSVAHIHTLRTHYPSLQIINGYGPTENTTFSLGYEITTDSAVIPVGKPISNSTAYILDSYGQLCGIGVVGEICVGGAGLALGYLNNPELTAEKFVPHFYKENERLYKTGDLGRWLADGNIAFMGRKDDQVKIRGYRIELGEIAGALQESDAVEAAVVTAIPNSAGDKELVAYIVSTSELNITALNIFLGGVLPSYMIPDHYVQLAALPLTANGKIDRRHLPDPSGLNMGSGVDYVAARDETEAKLVSIWEDILGREKISVKDNFFDLGGHSLKATRLASQIHKDFEVKIPLKDLFTHLVLEEQGALIRGARTTAYSAIAPVAVQADYALSSSQQRLWVLSQFEEGNAAYNMPATYLLEGAPDIAALEYAFNALIARHEILRTVFREDAHGHIRQFIYPSVDFVIAHRNVAGEELLLSLIQQDFTTPFDLSVGPLLRAHLYQVSAGRWVLSYVMHHIISDGWSMGILIKELLQYYNARIAGTVAPLTPLRIQYKDYAAWQQEQLNGESLKQHAAYWLAQLEGPLPVLRFPLDKIRPSLQSYHGSVVNKLISARLTKGLKAISQQEGGTLFMGLLSAVNILLYRYTNQEDIIIGSPISGREHADLEEQIGFYLNTLAIRTRFKGSDSYLSLLRSIKAVTLGAYEHQVYPFDELVNMLQLKRDRSRGVLFDVMVLLQNFNINEIPEAAGEMVIKRYEGGERVISKYDLTFYFSESGEEIVTTIEYNTDIFERATIDRLAGYLENVLNSIVTQQEATIDELVVKSLGTRQVSICPDINTTALCSEHQKRLWFIDQFEKDYLYTGSPVYHNLPLIVKLSAAPDIAAMNERISSLINSVAVLRTRIVTQDSEPFPQITEDAVNPIRVHQLEGITAASALLAACKAIVEEPFDIATDHLIRFDVICYNGSSYIFILTAHHLVADRKSLKLLLHAIVSGENNIGGMAYASYAGWQQQLPPDVEESLSYYWQRKLKGAPVLHLDTDVTREHIHIYDAAVVSRLLPVAISEKLETFCRTHGSNAFSFLLTAFQALLHRYTGSEEVVIGTLYENRDAAEIYHTIGPVANLVTLKSNIAANDSFLSLLAQVSADYDESVEAAGLPFEKVVLDVNPGKDMSRTALFDVMIHYEKGGLRCDGVEEVELNHGLGKYDLNLLIKEDNGWEFFLTYNKKYFHASRIERFIDYYLNIIGHILAQPSHAVGMLEYLGVAEKAALLNNDFVINYPRDKTLVHLLEAQAAQTPDHIAVVCGDDTLTYQSLHEQANQLGHYLRTTCQVKRDDLIGIKLDRGLDMIVAILGVLKSGGAYVPIDPEYPQERIDYMVSDSACKVLIDEKLLAQLRKENKYSIAPPEIVNEPSDLAYVIYTSGTTGRPKGSLITHNNVVRLFKTETPLFDFNAADVWTMFHSYCFDFSVWEMYGALLYGGKVVIVPGIIAKDPAAFVSLLAREKVTVLNQTPSAFYNVIKQSPEGLPLRYVIFGGEALSPGKLSDWQQQYPATRLINMYGITETTVHVTYKEITSAEISTNSSNIGRPIPTLQCYVLDQQQQLLPAGVSGELYVGGEGVCRGYLNRSDLTAQRFIDNPFKPGERLYRTGDKARLLENGELEYAGRIDDQVKIRGYRIELGEIEHVLRRHEHITDVVVIARADEKGEYDLIAYVVSKTELKITDLRLALSSQLPNYMLPAYFVQLDRLPLTSNGKIDKKNLPAPSGQGMSTGMAYVPPRNEIEERMVLIWQDILGRDKIGVKDNFFDLGGHSLKAARLKAQIKKEFNVEMGLRNIFEEPTLEVLSDKVSNDKWLQVVVVEGSDNDYDEIKV